MKFIEFAYEINEAADNMALDYDLLQREDTREDVLIRFYGWEKPALTFGYSQRYEAIAKRFPSPAIDKIRRTTGGGIVEHGKDLTYCLKVPVNHPSYRISSSEFYQELHQRISHALSHFGLSSDLSPCIKETCRNKNKQNSKTIANACFERAEPFDLINPIDHSKIAGAALKRDRLGLLVQGSIQLTDTSASIEIITKLIEAFHDWLLPKTERVQVKNSASENFSIIQEKMMSSAWNKKR